MKGICVRNEIQPLKKVLLHRPGRELLKLTPKRLGELLLLKKIGEFPAEVAADAALRKPNKLTDYIISLVKTFHAYYNAVKVNNPDDPELTNQRLGLVTATKITLKNALSLIGVSAPDSM